MQTCWRLSAHITVLFLKILSPFHKEVHGPWYHTRDNAYFVGH